MTFTLNNIDVNKIFIFKDYLCVGVNKTDYHHHLCESFAKQFCTTVQVKGYYSGGKTISFRLYCAFEGCSNSYKLSIKKEEIHPDKDLLFDFASIICKHNQIFAARYYSRGRRANAFSELKGMHFL
jgi:hypothetical protein